MQPITNHQLPMTGHHGEINLMDYWRVIFKYRKMIVIVLAITSVASVIMTLLMPKTYRADALIIPISSRGGGGGLSSLAAQFGGLASLAGLSVPGGANDMEKIVAVLKSRTLAENVVTRENLMLVLFKDLWDAKANKWKSDDPQKQPTMEAATKRLRAAVTMVDDKKNRTIRLSGVFNAPELAARVVNAYIDELQKFINANAFTMAKRNRIFIEGQLDENKEDLLEAGKEINEFYQGNRISSAEAKIDVPLNGEPRVVNSESSSGNQRVLPTASLESDVTAHGTPIVLQETVQSGELQVLLAEKSTLEKQIAEARTVKNVPQQVYLSYLMLQRELLGKVNALLTSQYEMAKIEESKEELSFQIIDKAVPPVMRFSPKRAQICIMAFMAALFASVFIAFLREYLGKMKQMHAEGGR